MTAGNSLLQISLVFGITIAGVWGATQWTAAALGYQARLGLPWFDVFGVPIYRPWQLFQWWYFYDAYAPAIFNRGGEIAAAGGILSAFAAIAVSVWRARASDTTTYGSARWATPDEIEDCGLTQPDGLFLGQINNQYSAALLIFQTNNRRLAFLSAISARDESIPT